MTSKNPRGPRRPKAVREPVQVYLDPADQRLLARLAGETGLSKAELLRRGLRRLAGDALAERAPGSSLDTLVGALGEDPDLPADLAARHDQYLYGEPGRGEPGVR